VGEGGWGDEGQKAWECSKLRIAPKNSTLERVLTGVDALASPGAPSSVSAIRSPQLPCGRRGALTAYRGRFLGKPRRAISRFSHQDAPTPPSPLVGEGGRGDEGQKAWECSKLRIAPKNSTLERVLTGVDALASPGAPSSVSAIRSPQLPCGRRGALTAYRGRFLRKPRRAISRFSHQDAPTPPSPLVGEGGRGDEGHMSETPAHPARRRFCHAARCSSERSVAGIPGIARLKKRP
jgi:hypothetical protein